MPLPVFVAESERALSPLLTGNCSFVFCIVQRREMRCLPSPFTGVQTTAVWARQAAPPAWNDTAALPLYARSPGSGYRREMRARSVEHLTNHPARALRLPTSPTIRWLRHSCLNVTYFIKIWTTDSCNYVSSILPLSLNPFRPGFPNQPLWSAEPLKYLGYFQFLMLSLNPFRPGVPNLYGLLNPWNIYFKHPVEFK